MKTRIVDRVSFWAIRHLLSRARHRRFDRAAFDRFVETYRGRSAAEFYGVEAAAAHAGEFADLVRAAERPGAQLVRGPSPFPIGWPENDRVWAQFHLVRPLREAPVFLIQHGWRSVSVRGYHGLCRKLNALGVNAAVLHLPFHFSRRPRGSFNGELAISSDLARNAEALRQGVREACWMAHGLKQLGAPAVGLWGTSYGAWVAALALARDAVFDGALLLEAPADIETLFWELPLFTEMQRALEAGGIARASLRELFDLAIPWRDPPKADPSSILILGAERDPIATPDSLRRWQSAWSGSYLEIFPCGHVSYRLHRFAMQRFLEKLAPRLLTVAAAARRANDARLRPSGPPATNWP
ncbi:MAG: hypothetical protein IT578_04785 [Verrucomicrobiae bacterium]|nr:hypothetical protein [Verrucomicrobiae bacterium]